MLVICACLGEASFIMCVPSGKAWLVERVAAACRLAHLRGWLICGLMCWMGACLGTPGCGFWWATWAAMGVKSLSPFVTTPATMTGAFGGLLATYSSSSSSFWGGSGAGVGWCFRTILIPPALTAGRCPPLVSAFSCGGDDMFDIRSLRRKKNNQQEHGRVGASFFRCPKILDCTLQPVSST